MRPADERELAGAVLAATGPLVIRGGGTRTIGHPAAGKVLDTTGLDGITLYEPGALTLVVRAGTLVTGVERILAAERQRFAFEVPDFRQLLGRGGASTIGGVVAANASGPRRVQAGACRDALIGVRFVDGSGTVIKNGGRVMKNVTGYDLVKLMAGSRGTLGVLSEVSFKLQAVPEAEATLVGPGLEAGAAVAAMARALGSPFDVSGAAWSLGTGALVRVEGLAGSVAYRAGQLQRRLGGEWSLVTGAQSAALWASIRDVSAFAGQPGAVWRLSVKPSDGPHLLSGLRMTRDVHQVMLDWGGGLVWLLVDDAGDAGAGAIRAEVSRFGGHATLVRGPAKVAVFHPEPAAIAALSAGLLQKFDPRGIFNQGLMG